MFNSKHAMNRHEFNSAMGYENDMVPCPCHNNNPDCPYCYGTGIFQIQPIEEENVAADKMVQRFINIWEKHPVAKESDLPAHYKGSKYATSDEDEIAKHHHNLASNLIDTRIIPALNGVTTAATTQEIMNLVAADHEKQFPNCQHCGKLRGEAFKPAETSDIIEDIRKVFNEEKGAPVTPKDAPVTPKDMSMRPKDERGDYIPMDELPDDTRIEIHQQLDLFNQQQKFDL